MSADRPQRNFKVSDPIGMRSISAEKTMATSPTNDANSTLSCCRDMAAELLSKSLSTMLDKIEESLFDLAEKALDRDTYNLYMQARGEAQAKRPEIEAEFRRRFVEGFETAIHGKEKSSDSFNRLDLDKLELSLVGHDDYEEDLAVTSIASKLRNKLGEDLNALNQRIGHLMSMPEGMRENNPMAPHAIVEAFRSACQKIESDLNVRLLVLKQFEQVAGENVPDVYQNLNRFLVERNILPVLPKTGYRRRAISGGRAPGAPQSPTHSGDHVAAGDMGGGDMGGGFGGGYGGGEQVPAAPGGDYVGVGYGGPANYASQAGYGAQMGFGAGGFAPAAAMAGGGLPAYAVGNEQELITALQRLLALNQVVQTMPTSGPASTPQGAVVATQPQAAEASPMPMGPSFVTSVGQSFLDALNRLQQGTVEGTLADIGELDANALVTGRANVLHQIKSTSLASSLGHVDAMTIDIVAMLFDYIFDDSNIPGPMKALIGRLQIPVLKVAMLDSKFFARKHHPTRRLLDGLAQAALGWSEEDGLDDRLYKKIAALVENIVDEFDENIDIFDTALVELEAFLAEEEQQAESSAEASATQLIEAERAELAKLRAVQTVNQRLANTAGLAELITDFLKTQWTVVLAHALQLAEEDKAPWQDAARAMDDLIWSVAPKVGVEERLRLVNLLPKLLKSLERGTEAAGIDRTVRESFFAELVHCHAQAIKSGLKVTEVPAAVAPVQAATLSELPVAPPSESGALQAIEFNSTASVATAAAPTPAVMPAGQAAMAAAPTELADLLDLPSLDIGPVGNLFEVTDQNWDQGIDKYRDYDDVVANQLKRGAWVDFVQADGNSLRAKLAWISPRKSRYLFTNRQGQNGMEFTLVELIGMFKSGEASMIETSPSMERAVSDMIGMLQPAGA